MPCKSTLQNVFRKEQNMSERHYSLKDAAQILGIKIRTARQWVHDGKMQAVKYSGMNRWYVTESEIRRLKEG